MTLALARPAAAHLARYRGHGLYRERTIADLARDRAMAAPDGCVFLGEPGWTVARIVADAEALHAALVGLGVRPGEVIAFQTPNWPEATVIDLACALGGFVVAPIVIIYRDAEVAQMLADSRSRVLFAAATFRGFDFAAMVERLRPALPHLAHVALVRASAADGYEAMVAARDWVDGPRVDPDSVKLLLYTSGTTGRPKGVLHSHNTLARVTDQAVSRWGIEAGDAVLMPSPVTHISGFSNGLELPFQAGTRTVLMEAWNAEAALGLIAEHGVAGTVAATLFLAELTAVARARGERLPSLRFFACGGAAVAPDIVRQANEAFARPCAFRVFGSSEVPLVTLGYQGARDAELAATTDGAIVDYDVRLVNEAGGPVADGSEGEILARGPSMMLGYADAAQTAEAIDVDGFFRTGDLGRITPEGALVITGRVKDLIIRGGENISAKEIEDVLAAHPGVAQVAVVAMPHARLGEGVCAFVVARGDAPEPGALAEFVGASGLARQKIPERFVFVGALPMTASGKVRKDQLREAARALASAPQP